MSAMRSFWFDRLGSSTGKPWRWFLPSNMGLSFASQDVRRKSPVVQHIHGNCPWFHKIRNLQMVFDYLFHLLGAKDRERERKKKSYGKWRLKSFSLFELSSEKLETCRIFWGMPMPRIDQNSSIESEALTIFASNQIKHAPRCGRKAHAHGCLCAIQSFTSTSLLVTCSCRNVGEVFHLQ